MSQSLSLTGASLIPTTARSPRVGVVVAVALHAAVVAVTLFSWRHTLDIADRSPLVVPIDLVTVADKTNIAPTAQKTVARQEAPTPPPPITPPPQAIPETAPTPQAKPAPPPQPATKPAPPKPRADDFGALLNKLTAPAPSPRNTRVADRTVKGIGAMNAMTMDLVDALKNQIAQCWNPPTGGPHPDKLIPVFELFLNADGSVAQPPQLSADSASAAASDPYMRAAVEAARRAIMTCQPYKLAADKYAIWRAITIDFDPRQLSQ